MGRRPLQAALPILLLAGAGFLGARLLRAASGHGSEAAVHEAAEARGRARSASREVAAPGAPAGPALLPGRPASRPAAAADDPRRPAAAVPGGGPGPVATPAPGLEPAPPPRVLGALVAHAEALLRSRAQARLHGAASTARRQFEEEVAAEHDEREDAARGGWFALLREVGAGRGSLVERASEAERFARAFPSRPAGALVDPQRLDRTSQASDGDRLLLPAGRVVLTLNGWLSRQPAARDLVIEGAGRDETLCVLEAPLWAARDVFHLTFRDLTVWSQEVPLVHSRSGGVSVHLERCRVLGLGRAPVVQAGQVLLWAEDSEVDETYAADGGRQGQGWLTTGGSLVARLAGCAFRGRGPPLEGASPARHVVFERCVFRGLEPRWGPVLEGGAPGILLRGCTFELAGPEGDAPGAASAAPRPLREINPRWGEAPR